LKALKRRSHQAQHRQDKLIEVEAAKVQAQTQQAAADAQVKVARLQLDQQRAAQDADFKQQKLEIDAAKVVTNG
jgi:lipopolysaccharide export system protein LptC